MESSPTTTTNSIINKKHHKGEKTEKNDFSSLDVKASKPKSSKGKSSVEDDAWDLLNN